MKKALIGLFLLWGLTYLFWYQGYREGWRQATEAAEPAAVVVPPCIQEQSSPPVPPQLEDRGWQHRPSGVALTSL